MEALKDLDPYVRKTAITGCIKVFYMSPESIKSRNDLIIHLFIQSNKYIQIKLNIYFFFTKEEVEIIELLYKMIRDQDPLVVTNALEALKEILAEEGGISISSKMIVYLLNRLKEFNEWGN